MIQMELFEGLEPIQKYLHVWTDAERKKTLSREAQGESLPKQVGGLGLADGHVRQLPVCRCGADRPNQHLCAACRTSQCDCSRARC